MPIGPVAKTPRAFCLQDTRRRGEAAAATPDGESRAMNTTRSLMALAALAVAAATGLLPAPAALAAPAAAASAPASGKAAAQPKLVDINSAPAKKLQSLPGISAEAAQRIVAKRPYGSKSQLVTRGALDEPTFQSIRHLIIARQP